MRDQIITNTATVRIDYALGAARVANVFHVKYSTTPGTAELDALEAAIKAWLSAEWAPTASDEWEALTITITDMGSLTGLRKAYAVSPVVPGTDAAQAMPPNVTLAIRASVGRRGKGIQGRVFWVGLAEDQSDNYVMDSAAVTDIISSLVALNSRIAAVTPFTGMAVPHLFVNKVPQNPAASELVTEFLTTDHFLDSQRDRLPYHKRHRKPKSTP